jgi:hypothetical protein
MGEEREAESDVKHGEFDKVSSLQRWSKDQIMATIDSGGGSIRTPSVFKYFARLIFYVNFDHLFY